ncbi:sigma-70 family RNA polymerase sigma factor [Pleurocapsales cyanobacterium LEGE 06147]|nr:sigma-70 family RNA polymerase sigma factor [Pleurocapsales cyanobacterium LEGE 06147]
MHPRQGIVTLFSTFIQFDFDRFSRWASDPRLRRSMERRLTQMSSQETSENFWAIYWHKAWLRQPQDLARDHLSAYLQEVCFWATQKTISGFTSTQYTIPDCFQVAISGVDKVLKGFDSNQGFNLKNYASITFSNLIRELLRQRQEVDICSDWALLRKLSQKRLIESLQNAGLDSKTIDRYVLAWNCWKTIYVPDRAGSTRKLSKPDAATWKAIAELYNSEFKGQLPFPASQANPETLEKWLLACVKAARAYLYPNVTSINQPRLGQDSGEIVDNLVGEVDDSLLTDMIASEEAQNRDRQQAQINQVLIEALKALDSQERQLLELYYARQLTQTEMAKELGTKQYNVSRKLSRARQLLLKSLARWSQTNLHISLSSDVLKGISALLEEWLTGYYSRS